MMAKINWVTMNLWTPDNQGQEVHVNPAACFAIQPMVGSAMPASQIYGSGGVLTVCGTPAQLQAKLWEADPAA